MLRWEPHYVVLDNIIKIKVVNTEIVITFTKSQILMKNKDVKLLVIDRDDKQKNKSFNIKYNKNEEFECKISLTSAIFRDWKTNGVLDLYFTVNNKKYSVTTQKNTFPFVSIDGYDEMLQVYRGETGNLTFRKIKNQEIIRLDNLSLEDDSNIYADARISLPYVKNEKEFNNIKVYFVTESRSASFKLKEQIDNSEIRFNPLERAAYFNFIKKVQDEFLRDDFVGYFLIESEEVIKPNIFVYGEPQGFNRSIKGKTFTFMINGISKTRKLDELEFLTKKRLFIPSIKHIMLDKKESTYEVGLDFINNNIYLNDKKKKESSIIIKKRNTMQTIVVPIDKFTDKVISFRLKFKDIAKEKVLTTGTWDFYLRYDNFDYRISYNVLANYNPNKVISYPMSSFKHNNNYLSSKLYITGDGHFSLFLRNQMIHSYFEYIFSKKQVFKFKALMKMYTPINQIQDVKKGTLKIKGVNGEIKKIEGNLIIKKVENTNVMYEYTFEAEVDKKDPFFKQNLFNDNWILQFIAENKEYSCSIPPNKDKFYTKENFLRKYLPEHILRKLNEYIYQGLKNTIPVSKKHYLFQSHHGKQYSCNPRAIYEELYKVKPNNKYIWIMKNDRVEIPGNPIIVKPYTLKYFYYLARSKYLINNGNFLNHYQKRKGTLFIQTWHGTPLKRLGFDLNSNTANYQFHTSEALVKRNSNWDVLLSSNNHTSKALSSAFKFNNQLAEYGYPRNDELVNEINDEEIDRIKVKYNVPKNKKVILYSPTWRDTENISEPFELGFNIETFQEKFSTDYVLLLRLHPIDTLRFHSIVNEENIINVSFADEINELYKISDLMITDYSSTMFDYANTKKPLILYMYDYSRYVNSLRGLYFDIKKINPGVNAFNQEQLFEAITSAKNHPERFNKFYEEFCHLDQGNAARKIVEKYLI